MKIFISGASGLLGGNCMQYFGSIGWDVVGSHLSYPTPSTCFFDTLQPSHPDNFDVAAYGPDVILHCGALTHVDYCEQYPEESYEKTVRSTQNIIDLCKRTGARLVFVSTDYVFDGTDGPYRENAPVRPLSVYGQHKLEAERMAMDMLDHTLVIRITNVYGNELRGKNFVARIVQQCKDGQRLSLRLPYDQFASPTNALDIARALYVLIRDGKNGIYHICSSDYMNRVELALRVLSHFPDAEYNLEAISTEEMAQPAARPLLGGFVKQKFASEYPDFLFGTVDSYLAHILASQSEE